MLVAVEAEHEQVGGGRRPGWGRERRPDESRALFFHELRTLTVEFVELLIRGLLDLFVGGYLRFDPEYRYYYAAEAFPGCPELMPVPDRHAEVGTLVPGRVAKVHVNVGDSVDELATVMLVSPAFVASERVVPEFVFYAWRDQIMPGDVQEMERLAKWSRKNGLFTHAWAMYKIAADSSSELRSKLPGLEQTMRDEVR